jgi:hypothetical protein
MVLSGPRSLCRSVFDALFLSLSLCLSLWLSVALCLSVIMTCNTANVMGNKEENLIHGRWYRSGISSLVAETSLLDI